MTGETPVPAAAPFDDENADVILRTSDKVDFYVYKIILSYASPFFKTMFSLPTPSQTISGQGASGTEDYGKESKGSVATTLSPTVDMQEKSDVVRLILECCYPIDRPTIPDVQLASQVLEACEKYELESVERYVRPIFEAFATKEPLRVYAFSCRNGWKSEAKLAAKLLLGEVFPFPSIPELSIVSGEMYHRLAVYHRACGAAASNAISYINVARKVLSTSTDAGSAYCFFSCRTGNCPPAQLDEEDPVFQAALTGGPLQDSVLQFVKGSRRWFQDFIVACQARIKEQPHLGRPGSDLLREEISVAHRRASPCGTCRTNAFSHLIKLVDTHFLLLLHEATNEVDFNQTR